MTISTKKQSEAASKDKTSWYWRNRDRARAGNQRRHFLRKYGITLEQRDALLKDQGGHCAICTATDPTERGWVVDHCHQTGAVRGILCQNCNLLLGHARDNPRILSNAISYLGP